MSEEKRDYPEWLEKEQLFDPDAAAPETGKKKKKPAAEESTRICGKAREKEEKARRRG